MLVSLVVFGVEKPHPAKTAQARFNIIQRRGGGAFQRDVEEVKDALSHNDW